MPTIIKNNVPLTVKDGTTMQTFVAYPSGGSGLPGMMVFQEAFGVNAHIRDVAGRIAAEGYYAIAPELYHRTADRGFTVNYSDFEGTKKHMQALTVAGLSDDIATAYRFMNRQKEVDESRTGSIGFCLGGRVSFLAAALLPLKAAACFYGGDLLAIAGGRVKDIGSALLLCWGGRDTHITKETRDRITKQLDEAEKDYVNVVFSKAGHAFFCDARSSYHEPSALEAWELTKAFWKIHI